MSENKKIRTLSFEDSSDVYEFIVKSENIDGQVGVGRTIENGGEIFNDYENNKALSPNSHTEGLNNTSGIKGYKMYDISIITPKNSATIYIDDEKCDEKMWKHYKRGDILEFSGTKHYNGILKIDGLGVDRDGKTFITVKPLFGTLVTTASDDPNEIYLALDPALDDPMENWCWVTGKNYGIPVLRHIGAHTEGESNIAAGRAATVSGRNNKAIGDYADAGGRGTVAHYAGFSRGLSTKATGTYAAATGQNTTASGLNSTASGFYTTASGEASHAQNANNTASHKYSNVAGYYNMSGRDSQTVVGEFNAESKTALFVVGNGTGVNNNIVRNNAFMVNENGTATIGANPLGDMDVVTKNYLVSAVNGVEQRTNAAIADAEQRVKQSATKSVVFKNEYSLFSSVFDSAYFLNSAKWGSGSKNHHYEAPNKWNIENITAEINGNSYITGFKLDRVTYQGFYLEIDSSAFNGGGVVILDFCTSSNVPLSVVRVLKANYRDDGTLSSPTYSDEDGRTSSYEEVSYIDFSVTELRDGKSYSIAFEPTGDCDRYHVYFAMGGIGGISLADSYLIVHPICIGRHASIGYKTLNLANCNLNKGDLVLIEDSSSPDYWWTGTWIKPLNVSSHSIDDADTMLTDTSTGIKYRLYVENGELKMEVAQ